MIVVKRQMGETRERETSTSPFENNRGLFVVLSVVELYLKGIEQ